MGFMGIHGYQQIILNPASKYILRNSLYNFKLKINPVYLRNLSVSHVLPAKTIHKYQLENNPDDLDNIPEVIKYKNDSRIIYSSYIDDHKVSLTYLKRRKLEESLKHRNKVKNKEKAIPLIIEMLKEHNVENIITDTKKSKLQKKQSQHFPYAQYEKVNFESQKDKKDIHETDGWNSKSLSVVEDIALRMQSYEEGKLHPKGQQRHQDDSEITWNKHKTINNSNQQGSCDLSIPASSVPCGGCGAALHCQDEGLPGFLPKERFVGLNKGELRSIRCQRCHFLRYYKMALNVRVSPDLYPKLLEAIRAERALVMVVVDVMDVPCSIWPGLLSIIGTKRPVVIVGNKTDLLPADGPQHLSRVLDSLTAAVENTDLGRANIKHITLVSALNGYGIESLINKIHKSWGISGDVYIVGCTNSGKSTLFNALLGSDMCKTDASELIQRATTSPWPGTTLNMLKFPLLRPSGGRLTERVKRLQEQQVQHHLETKTKPKFTKNIKLATLSGYIGNTFKKEEEIVEERADPFSMPANRVAKGSQKILGINTDHPQYRQSKWCYDTPGTVQPDQLLSLLSHEELIQVLPRHLLVPKTFYMKTGTSLFIGGLARLDLLYSTDIVRFTLFCSSDLPTSIVPTVEASSFYRSYLGSDVLGVPMGNGERLKQWPHLQPRNLTTTGVGQISAADVILSSAGFIALQGKLGAAIDVRGWTPGGRGIYLRDPPMLPKAVTMRGQLIRGSVAYGPHTLMVPTNPR